MAGGQDETAVGTQDPVELAQGGDAVADVVDDQGGEDEVHGFVAEPVERVVEVALAHVDAGSETGTGVADHVGALVEPGRLRAACDQFGQVQAGPASGVQDAPAAHVAEEREVLARGVGGGAPSGTTGVAGRLGVHRLLAALVGCGAQVEQGRFDGGRRGPVAGVAGAGGGDHAQVP